MCPRWSFSLFGDALDRQILRRRVSLGTLLVNAVGSFLLGLILGSGFEAKDVWLSSEATYAFAALGFCGGLTTFSTFSLETFSLVSDQAWAKALANILGSVLLCVLCVLSGYAIGEGLTQ